MWVSDRSWLEYYQRLLRSKFVLFFFFTNCQVRGDETLVLQSVLECDTEREKLLEEEKKLLSLTGHGRYIAFNYYRGIE